VIRLYAPIVPSFLTDGACPGCGEPHRSWKPNDGWYCSGDGAGDLVYYCPLCTATLLASGQAEGGTT